METRLLFVITATLGLVSGCYCSHRANRYTYGGGDAGTDAARPDGGEGDDAGDAGVEFDAGSDAGLDACPVLVACFPDGDADGWGAGTGAIMVCSCPVGYVGNNEDCHDGNADVHPGAGYHAEPYTVPPTFTSSYDYDCSGTEDKRWYRGSMLGCSGSMGACRLDEGFAEMPISDACGAWVTVVQCTITCGTTTQRVQQECR